LLALLRVGVVIEAGILSVAALLRMRRHDG
jgi:hypothetical protein